MPVYKFEHSPNLTLTMPDDCTWKDLSIMESIGNPTGCAAWWIKDRIRVLKELSSSRPRKRPATMLRKPLMDSDWRWEQAMGRKWDRPYSEQFAYTGGRKGDKELLASLAP